MIGKSQLLIVFASFCFACALVEATPAHAQYDQMLRSLLSQQPAPSIPAPQSAYPTFQAPVSQMPSASRPAPPSHAAPPRPTPSPLAHTEANSATVVNASFDCSRAHTAVERLICLEPRLGRLDQEIAASFATARVTQPDDGAGLMAAQRAWLQRRDACGANLRCLEQSMDGRLAQLRAMTKEPALQTAGADQGAPAGAISNAAGATATVKAADTGGAVAAARPWQLPLAEALPVFDLNGGNRTLLPPRSMWDPTDTPRPQPEAMRMRAWTRVIRLLGLRGAGPRPDQLSDVTARALACTLLSRTERTATFGTLAIYRGDQDICDTLYLTDDPTAQSGSGPDAGSAIGPA